MTIDKLRGKTANCTCTPLEYSLLLLFPVAQSPSHTEVLPNRVWTSTLLITTQIASDKGDDKQRSKRTRVPWPVTRTKCPVGAHDDPVEGAAEQSVLDQHRGLGPFRGPRSAVRNAMKLQDVAVLCLNSVHLYRVPVLRD